MQAFRIVTLGCKVNQCESQLLREQLVSLGLHEAAAGERADLCIVNTCAVTATAQGKSARALRKLQREHPKARTAAIGCGVSMCAQAYPQADVLVRQEEKSQAARRILGRDSTVKTVSAFSGHARAFLKIQDGCDSFCSYCIVPYLRGKPHSKPPALIKREARALAGNGYKELVLAGTHLGLYGRDLGAGADLAGVVEKLLEAGLFPRVRLSGVEVTEVSDKLIELAAADNALCSHLHIPLQSGSAQVLSDMGRSYTPAEFLAVVERLRARAPQVSITTDVIVGFPTEEEHHFEETLELCRRAAFARMHVFPYSRREGTAAARKWKSGAVKDVSRRSKTLRALATELADSYAMQFAGKPVRVLVESHASGKPAQGYTEHYLRAQVHHVRAAVGELVEGTALSSREGVLSVEGSRVSCGGNR